MNSLVVYESQYGNTEQIARAVGAQLAGAGPVRIVAAESPGAFNLQGVDLLVVGGPTVGHGPSARLRALLKQVPAEALSSVTTAAFDTRYAGPKFLTGSAADGIAHELKAKGAWFAGPPASFLVSGREGPLTDGELARAAEWATALRDQVRGPVAESLV